MPARLRSGRGFYDPVSTIEETSNAAATDDSSDC